jgi:hypothetical protein
MRFIALASLGIIVTPALTKVGVLLYQSGHFLPVGICSLLHGFVPLVGAVILNILLIHLLLRFVRAAERELLEEGNSPVPEPDERHGWHNFPPPLLTSVASFLSRSEHSPPAVVISMR